MRALTHTEILSTAGANHGAIVLGIVGTLAGSTLAAKLSYLPALLIFLKAYEARSRHAGWVAMGAFGYLAASTAIGGAIGGVLGATLGNYLDNEQTKSLPIVENTANITR